ncbi:MAG: beta-eliminating lyase-related protein, partial [Candidatus Wallbacteria bacterium]|nr:beta-eliminating lyase-related protein [Candidatus Wallbacteria bacterium]
VHTDEHSVKPRVVFISDSTEIGTVYGKRELRELSAFCRQHDLYLYLDGARIASALTAGCNDLTLAELASLVDAFYIGGTKNGALLGEAIVIVNDDLKQDFRFYLKQKGALLAKGRILGIQFQELFKDDLFFELGKHANSMAALLANGIRKAGFSFLSAPVSNQVFPVFPDSLIRKLSKKYGFHIWRKTDADHSAVRLVCSWATPERAVSSFVACLEGSLPLT